MKAYSLDLRTRMFSYALTHSVRKTATLFRVNPNTVHVLKKFFIETGQLAPKPSRAGRPRAISAEGWWTGIKPFPKIRQNLPPPDRI